MIRVTDQYFWNFVFSVFFLILIIMGAIILEGETRIPLDELTLTDYVLMTLATWRLTRLFVYDAITRFFREQFWDVVKVGKGFALEKPKFGPRRTLADLLSCVWCFGMWAAATVIFFYLLTPFSIFPITLLAIGAVASFLQLLSNLIGVKSESV
ncbi:MAG: DUF1360 domain-containing protein [Patescibacteria group bacterium]|mgnify:CR=1 FL=1